MNVLADWVFLGQDSHGFCEVQGHVGVVAVIPQVSVRS